MAEEVGGQHRDQGEGQKQGPQQRIADCKGHGREQPTLHALEGEAPLNAWLERGENDWRLVLFPRLTILASLEIGGGLFVNPVEPVAAASALAGVRLSGAFAN